MAKYHVSKKENRTCDGIVFDSQLEMRYYKHLCSLREAGEVERFELQVPYELQPKFVHNGKTVRKISYIADFVVYYSDGHIEVIDTKGRADSTAKIKRKMFFYHYPEIDYQWISWSREKKDWVPYEEIKKKIETEKSKKKKEQKNESK